MMHYRPNKSHLKAGETNGTSAVGDEMYTCRAYIDSRRAEDQTVDCSAWWAQGQKSASSKLRPRPE